MFLSIESCYFHSNVNSIYPTEFEIKDTTDSETRFIFEYFTKNRPYENLTTQRDNLNLK